MAYQLASEPVLEADVLHWQLGRFELYRLNLPLVRVVAALPKQRSLARVSEAKGEADSLSWCSPRCLQRASWSIL